MSVAFGQYHFQGQRENEEVLRIIHRHWFNIALHFFAVIFALALLSVSILFLPSFATNLDPALAATLQGFTLSLLYLFLWVYGFLVWVDYYFDVWIITNDRIVNIEQKGLFAREVSELNFDRVQDVTCVVEGFIPTILNYGDVYVQTAGETERFLFRQVPDPYAIKDAIIHLANRAEDQDLRKVAEVLRVGHRTT